MIRIPTTEVCRAMIQEMAMLDHIVDHCRQVRRVALFLCERFLEQAPAVCLDRELVGAGALLHDITKTRSFTTGENHAETGGIYVADKGYREVATVVRQHVCLDRYPDPPVISEAALVNYADKRVLHDRIVTLEERMHYILERYGTVPERRERIDWLWRVSRGLEAAIFEVLVFTPEELPDRMAAAADPDREAIG